MSFITYNKNPESKYSKCLRIFKIHRQLLFVIKENWKAGLAMENECILSVGITV